jgi:hypothetical protein
MMSSWLLKIFQHAIRCNGPANAIKNMKNWVVISWICGEDQLAQREGSKLVQIAEFTWESLPISPIQNSIRVQFRIQEKSTLKLMPRSHTTSNKGILELVGKIRRLYFQWDQSHIQLKSELTGIYETTRVSRTYSGVVTPYFGLWPVYHVRAQ